jgi:hypothetical protein
MSTMKEWFLAVSFLHSRHGKKNPALAAKLAALPLVQDFFSPLVQDFPCPLIRPYRNALYISHVNVMQYV